MAKRINRATTNRAAYSRPVTFYDKPERTPEGFLIVPVVIAQKGVLDYPEFKTKELLGDDIFSDDYLASCDGCPFVVNHPTDDTGQPIDVNGDNFKKLIDGILYNPQVDKANGRVLGLVKIFNPAVCDAVERGDLRELSQGYNCKVIEQNGVYDGEKYTRVQSDVVMNHIALVEQGRAGDAVKILYNNRASVELVPALKKEFEKFERRRENMKIKRKNVDEQTTAGKPNPQNTVNEEESEEQQASEDTRMSTLEEKVESLATAVAELIEKMGGKQNAEEEDPEKNKLPTENADDDKEDAEKKNSDKEVMNRVTNSLPAMVAKQVQGYMSEMQTAAAQAMALLGEDAQDLAFRMNDIPTYRKAVLKRTNTFSEKEVNAMNETEVKATLAVLTKTAKLRINSATSDGYDHSAYNPEGDVISRSASDL